MDSIAKAFGVTKEDIRRANRGYFEAGVAGVSKGGQRISWGGVML